MSKYDVFKRGSKTFFYSSLFFPRSVRNDVASMYAFVRFADDLVDAVPQKRKEFFELKGLVEKSWKQGETTESVVDELRVLAKKKDIPSEWVSSFLQSMEADLTKSTYKTYGELIHYMYGSAEVVGLMMARILGLPAEADAAARMMGRSMQMINFIRDIKEDNELGRMYIPQVSLRKYGLKNLSEEVARTCSDEFRGCIRENIKQYRVWREKGEEGLRYIPWRYRIAVRTASELYAWTAEKIEKDPFVVFERKVKPSVLRILLVGVRNIWG